MYYPIKYGAVCAEDYLPFYDPENPEVKEGENASCTFDCLKDGTYKFCFTSYGLTETGTWSFNNYAFKYVDANGGEHAATIVAK